MPRDLYDAFVAKCFGVDPAGYDAAAADPAAQAPVIAKARTAWVATRHKVDSDLTRLEASFSSAFKGHAKQADLAKAFRSRVETVLGTLDEGLAHTLDAINNASDPAARSKLVDQAHALIASYQQHVASDRTIAELDSNPFVPLNIQRTMTSTLTTLSNSIR